MLTLFKTTSLHKICSNPIASPCMFSESGQPPHPCDLPLLRPDAADMGTKVQFFFYRYFMINYEKFY